MKLLGGICSIQWNHGTQHSESPEEVYNYTIRFLILYSNAQKFGGWFSIAENKDSGTI